MHMTLRLTDGLPGSAPRPAFQVLSVSLPFCNTQCTVHVVCCCCVVVAVPVRCSAVCRWLSGLLSGWLVVFVLFCFLKFDCDLGSSPCCCCMVVGGGFGGACAGGAASSVPMAGNPLLYVQCVWVCWKSCCLCSS